MDVSIAVGTCFPVVSPEGICCCLPTCNVDVVLLTLGAHAQEGYGTCLVCVSVCVHSSANNARFYAQNEVRRGLS